MEGEEEGGTLIDPEPLHTFPVYMEGSDYFLRAGHDKFLVGDFFRDFGARRAGAEFDVESCHASLPGNAQDGSLIVGRDHTISA